MKNIRKLVSDIHKGKDLAVNLELYRDMAVGAYHDYASIELVFSAYILMEELAEVRPEYAKKEKEVVEKIKAALRMVTDESADCGALISDMKSVRKEITEKMDLFTTYIDRMICYEYVLNRMERKYLSAKELDKFLAGYREEEFMQQLLLYIFSTEDQAVITENIRTVIGQMPVRMTSSKFFERLAQALTLYKDGEKSSLDSFVYMLRTSGMLYEANDYQKEYDEFAQFVKKLEECDYKELTKEEYDALTKELEQMTEKVHEVTDFYYSLQKVVNSIYAVALLRKYDEGSSNVVADSMKILKAVEDGSANDEMLIPLEGKIERFVEESSYLEAVLFEIRSSYQDILQELAYVPLFDDLAAVANLLSGSLFIDMEKELDGEKADASYVSQVTDALVKELEKKFAEVSKPVKRSIMGMILEKLPMIFKNSDEVKEYIQTSLFGCTDKVEKAAVLDILAHLIKED